MPSDRPQVRAFLSSTFSDFQEERDLLAKQVFPALRQKAKGRGVEVVDVDLRWGITEEQSQQGQTLPICLAEIENCRPYFIGLLGERYGWVPEPDQYSPELLERQGWLREHQGGASVTELEILHGVLNNPDMAGRALFYFRDPAYSTARAEAGEPGWRSEGEQERQKLQSLKQRIKASRFPVVEGLADPQAIAARIEADLWALIERQFPEGEQPGALAIEAARHASYRADRTGLYLGGEGYIQQLEQWICAGEQRLLITGDSGSGKSALIANWMAAHEQSHPGDVIYSHHLGCSNDANAVPPLLLRLIDTAAQLIEEGIKVPQDWWELVAKVGETLARLSVWARRRGCRWIWVLDGLDKLSAEDQQALPWLPLTIPEGIHVVTSALDCPARTILESREYRSLAIGPLQRPEQEALIDRYLRIFARQLDAGLKDQLLAHTLAGSPLFLRVLLEELRQCGRFETLKQQLDGYLSAQTIDDLYERVLERLEADGHGEAVQKALTALWASRAGLSETELLAITGLTPAAWAPIGIGLQAALGENQGRLVFGHDFLRIAVQHRYLPTEEQQRQVHSDLADWFEDRDGWDERDSEELPWQLLRADRLEDLRQQLLNSRTLAQLVEHQGDREVLDLWRAVRVDGEGELDDLIAEDVQNQVQEFLNDPVQQIWFVDQLASLLSEAGLYRELLLQLRTQSLQLEEASEGRDESSRLSSMSRLAAAHHDRGDYTQAEALYTRCLQACEYLLGAEHLGTLTTASNLALLYSDKGDYEQAEALYQRDLEASARLLGAEHPSTLTSINNLALLCKRSGNYARAQELYQRCLEARERLLGAEHLDTLSTVGNLAVLCQAKGDYLQAEALYQRCLEAQERLLGAEHPDTLNTANNIANLCRETGDYEQAEAVCKRALEASGRLLGAEHPSTLTTANNLGLIYQYKGNYTQAEALYQRCLEAKERLLGAEHPDTLITMHNLAGLYQDMGFHEQAEVLYRRSLDISERRLGAEHPSTLTTADKLAGLYQDKGDYEQADLFYRRCLEVRERLLGPEHPSTLTTVGNLAGLYREKGDYEQAEALYQRCLEAQEQLLGPEHPSTLTTVGNLAGLYQDKGDYEQAEALYKRDLEASARLLGAEHPSTLATVNNLAVLCKAKGDYEQAEALYHRCLEAQERLLSPEHPDMLTTVNNLALLYSDRGDYVQAEVLYQRCMEARERLLGPEHPSTLTTIGSLAKLFQDSGDYEQAEALYQRCLEAQERLLGAEHPDTNNTRFQLACLYSDLGRYDESIPLRRRELEVAARRDGRYAPDTLASIHRLAEDLFWTDELEESEQLYREALAGRMAALSDDDPATMASRYGLVRCLSDLERYEEAIDLLRQELAWSRQIHGDRDPGTLVSLQQLALALRETGELAEAEILFRELVAAQQQVLEPEDFQIGRALAGLSKTLEATGNLEEAAGYARQCLEHRTAHEGLDSFYTNQIRLDLARILYKLHRLQEALTLLNALQASLNAQPEQDDDDRELYSDAAELRGLIQA